jgi:hypothetical protein
VRIVGTLTPEWWTAAVWSAIPAGCQFPAANDGEFPALKVVA